MTRPEASTETENLSCDGVESSGGGRGCEGGVYDEEDGDHGYVPPAAGRPILWVLDITGSKIELALTVEMRC